MLTIVYYVIAVTKKLISGLQMEIKDIVQNLHESLVKVKPAVFLLNFLTYLPMWNKKKLTESFYIICVMI